MKQKRLNLILGVVALALLAGVYFGQKKPPPKGPPLTALKAAAVDHATIHHPNAADVVLQKTAGKWALAAPVQAPADALEVATITALAEAETRGTIEPKDVKLADLGLQPPGFTVTLNGVALDFGGIEPLNYRRYVQTGGKIYLVDDPPGSALGADYAHLVAKTLLPEGAPIASIAVPGLTVSRSADGKSWSAAPADPKAGAEALQKFVDAWSGARALWNTAPETGKAEAAPPETATVTLKDGQALHFDIVSRDPQLVLERADLKVRYNLAKNLADSLLKLPEPPPAPQTQEKVPGADKKAGAAPAPPAAQ